MDWLIDQSIGWLTNQWINLLIEWLIIAWMTDWLMVKLIVELIDCSINDCMIVKWRLTYCNKRAPKILKFKNKNGISSILILCSIGRVSYYKATSSGSPGYDATAPRALAVEECSCGPEYTGLSCEVIHFFEHYVGWQLFPHISKRKFDPLYLVLRVIGFLMEDSPAKVCVAYMSVLHDIAWTSSKNSSYDQIPWNAPTCQKKN